MYGENMNIICMYDVEGTTSVKLLHILRKYLFHVQRSVFQGTLTLAKFKKLEKELAAVKLKPTDQILFYFTYRDNDLYEKSIGKPIEPRNII